MTLRAIHDFELQLLEPFIAMTERGIRIDEPRRVAMLADVTAAKAPLEADIGAYVVGTILPVHTERIAPAKAHLFRERRVCACCRNGKAKRGACWACAGFEKKPTKKQLAERTAKLGVISGALLVCRRCNGAGAFVATVFNPVSPEQVKIVLYELLKLPPRMKDKKLTTDEKALKSLLAECDHKPEAHALISQLLQLGKLGTIAEILERIAPGPDGRIRAVYNPAGTETGRPSISETFLIESTNLGNMPKREATEPRFDVRSCFVPDEGCVFVEADLSGAELWPTAACSNDTKLLELLRSGAKPHRWLASSILGKPEADVTEQEYMLGKTANHALGYGMQWKTFMENVNAVADRTGIAINAKQAKLWHEGYHKAFPARAQWWGRTHGELVRTGKLTTCFGRARMFYGRNRGERLGDTHREYIAQEPQSTIADLTNRGLLRWWRQHDGKVGILLAQLYDSLLIQCKREHATLCAALVRRCLTEEIEVRGIRITIPVDVKVRESWAVCEETDEQKTTTTFEGLLSTTDGQVYCPTCKMWWGTHRGQRPRTESTCRQCALPERGQTRGETP